MKKNLYSYIAWKNNKNGTFSAISVVHYSSLENARKEAKKRGLTDKNGDIILRYHAYRGLEDKEYKINN